MSWKRFRPEHDKMFNDKRWPAIKASYLLRLAVDMELAAVTEVKIPKKGSQKAYTAVEA